MMFGQLLSTHKINKRLAKALISLRVCAGWSEPFAGRKYHISGNLMSRLNVMGTQKNRLKEHPKHTFELMDSNTY